MKEQIFSGQVAGITGSQVIFKTRTAATYRAETGSAKMVRKNGSPMGFEELLLGDRVEVRGRVWPDNSINAVFVRDLSLYPHNSTFAGKIVDINPVDSSFHMESRASGRQTIRTDRYTVFKKNKSAATFSDLEVFMGVKVKGVWERDSREVLAKEVSAILRLLKASFKGEVKMTSPEAITVVGENRVIYGVDISGSKVFNRQNKPVHPGFLSPGLRVQVLGKQAPETVRVFASRVKILS